MRDVLKPLRSIARRVLGRPRLQPIDRFLRRVPGLVHVGANSGQERGLYDALGLHVLWIEADPEVFQRLQANIANLPRQRAVNALVSDVEGEALDFNVASNSGLSSSIFPFSGHTGAWPHVRYVGQRRLVGRRLDRLIADERVDLANHRALVLDVQGAELRVLAGATGILPSFSWIRLPHADFEAYRGAPDIDAIGAFLDGLGFRQTMQHVTGHHPGFGTTAERLFARVEPRA